MIFRFLAALFILAQVTTAYGAASYTIQLRRDTPANWVKYNPILAAGETGCELAGSPARCTAQKIGDGVTPWVSLPYYLGLGANTFTGAQTMPDLITSGPQVDVRNVTFSGGAKGDGVTDDTAAIAAALTFATGKAAPKSGAVVYLPAGVYLHTGITVPSWVTLKGDGMGKTILRLKAGATANSVTIPASSIHASITALTIDGNKTANVGAGGHGIYFPSVSYGAGGNTTPFTKVAQSTYAYKYSFIDHVSTSNNTGDGAHVEASNYGVFTSNVNYSFNSGHGLYVAATDGIFDGPAFYEANGKSGIYNVGGNNKFMNAKSIWNGQTDNTTGAVYNAGARSSFINIESQDNYTHGFYNIGADSAFIGCISDNNGYSAVGAEGVSSRAHSGFYNSGGDVSFVGCKVVSYKGSTLQGDGHHTCEYPFYFTATPRRYDITVQGGVDQGGPSQGVVCNSPAHGDTSYQLTVSTDATAIYGIAQLSLKQTQTSDNMSYDIFSQRDSAGAGVGYSDLNIRRTSGASYADVFHVNGSNGDVYINGGGGASGFGFGAVRIPNGAFSVTGTSTFGGAVQFNSSTNATVLGSVSGASPRSAVKADTGTAGGFEWWLNGTKEWLLYNNASDNSLRLKNAASADVLIVNQTAPGAANKAVCWKSDAKTLGYCSTQPDSTGACTCN